MWSGRGAGKFVILMTSLMISLATQAQISYEGKARSRMAKGKWNQAQQTLEKLLKKDSLSAEARYLYSTFYFSKANPKFNIDSAYRFSLSALRTYLSAAPRQKERMRKIPLDSSILVRLRQQIDSAAFERAKAISTEKSYQDFIDRFVFAVQHDAAVELRDEEAFLEALKKNSYAAFASFVQKYPTSHRVDEAKERFEKLLYEDKTRDGKLKSYETFVATYPGSPHRKEAERNIFDIATAGGSVQAFVTFLNNYPDTGLRKKCADILYHLSKETGEKILTLDSDSLRRVASLERGYWVAVMKNERFGFIDQHGTEMIAPQYASIADEYLCGDVRTDFLVTSEGIVGRSGRRIFNGRADAVTDIGFGFLKVSDSVCAQVVHKSGFRLNAACLENAKVVSQRFVAVQVKGKWGLYAFNGKELLTPQFDDITSIQEVLIFTKSGRKSVKTVEQVAWVADRNAFVETLVFDDVKELDPGRYLVWNGALTGLLNSKLEFIVPLDRHSLTKTPYGYVTEKNGSFTIAGVAPGLEGRTFRKIKFYENWLQLEDEEGMKLFSMVSKKVIQSKLDSVWFSNHVAFAFKDDSLLVQLRSGAKRQFPRQTNVQFIRGPDSVAHFYSVEKNKKTVYDLMSGLKLFQIDFDEIEFLGHQIFLITRDGKKGLAGSDGKIILPVEYAIILTTRHDYASLFKDRKFGLYDLKGRKLIKAAFERNVIPFQNDLFVAYKDGNYGFIHADGKPVGKFEFEEIREWSDSVALVKKNFVWQVYDVYSGEVLLDKIKDYRPVLSSDRERIFIFHRENAYGVVSTERGVIIPATFSDIINLGSEDEPLYFTEKNVEEAGIFVVIYYDQSGKLIRRQVFEKEEYEKIYCEDR